MLFFFIHLNVLAEWVKVNENPRTSVYADPSTIRKSGNLIKMWTLLDLQRPEISGSSKPYLSIKIQTEYDCKNEQSRGLYATSHSENMGKGEVTETSSTPSKWSPVSPQSLEEAMWEFACKPRR
jgi:hypothetical protein